MKRLGCCVDGIGIFAAIAKVELGLWMFVGRLVLMLRVGCVGVGVMVGHRCCSFDNFVGFVELEVVLRLVD